MHQKNQRRWPGFIASSKALRICSRIASSKPISSHKMSLYLCARRARAGERMGVARRQRGGRGRGLAVD
eukprot:scaffold4407_cov123-Isochrysis_galbana.AAC.4